MSALRTLTFTETCTAFGDPRPFIKSDGSVSFAWEKKILDYVKLPAPLPLSWAPTVKATKLKCHRLMVGAFTELFQALYDDKEVWSSIGDTGGIFSFRPRRTDPKKLSLHSWGVALDVDVRENEQGHAPHVHQRFPMILADLWWVWGGTFQGDAIDAMHAEPSHQMCQSLGLMP